MTAPRTMLTVEQAATWLEVSRTTLYALIKTRQVESTLVGRYRRVPLAALETYINRLEHAAPGPRAAASASTPTRYP